MPFSSAGMAISGLPDRAIAEQKARQLLQAARELEADGRKAGITSSIGISLAPLQGSSYEELFAAADRCLYKVKNQGRDGYCIGTDEQVHHEL
ncbi:MAG: diguanylate cyclase [Selenomonadaceae bacterium]|nr:diguanylate cyclase [Selenomonadaceae bacterium]